MDIHLRNLRSAVAVADEGSFTGAAASLYITQPALSRQIRQLEDQLRFPIFDRDARGVRLTPAGQALINSAHSVLELWDSAVSHANAEKMHAEKSIRVGFNASGAGRLTTLSRVAFSQKYPDISVEPKRLDWGSEIDALRDGYIEVAFIWLPADTAGIEYTIVARESRVVGLSARHELSSQGSFTLNDLRDEPLLWTRRAPREWVDWWAVNPRPDGSEPVWGPSNDNVEEMLEHVAAGAGVCFAPASMAEYYARADLVWRPLLGVDELQIAVGCLSDRANLLARAFIQTVRENSSLADLDARNDVT